MLHSYKVKSSDYAIRTVYILYELQTKVTKSNLLSCCKTTVKFILTFGGKYWAKLSAEIGRGWNRSRAVVSYVFKTMRLQEKMNAEGKIHTVNYPWQFLHQMHSFPYTNQSCFLSIRTAWIMGKEWNRADATCLYSDCNLWVQGNCCNTSYSWRFS